MEQPEVKEPVAIASASGNDAPAPVASIARPAASSLAPRRVRLAERRPPPTAEPPPPQLRLCHRQD